jgi:hypothetical protein
MQGLLAAVGGEFAASALGLMAELLVFGGGEADFNGAGATVFGWLLVHLEGLRGCPPCKRKKGTTLKFRRFSKK